MPGPKLITSWLLFSFLSLARAENLSPEEQKMAAYIITQQSKQLSLLEKLVNINSGTANITGVNQVGKILQKKFEKIGFKTRWVKLPDSMHRASTLIAERNGNKGKRLLLIGHLDTVFAKNSPFQRFERHGSSATGPGVIDDKGGDVVILYALKALNTVKALDNASITVVLTGDEEDSGKPTSISRKALFEVAEHSDIALDFECDITQDTATIARRGISMWEIRSEGKEAHSAEIFKQTVGDGAIFEITRILNEMRTELAQEKDLAFNPGLILGGTKTHYDKQDAQGTAFGKENVIAKTAIATGDLRFLTPEQENHARERMTAIVNQHLLGTKASISFQSGIPSMPPTAANEDLLKHYSQVSEDLGYGSIKPLRPGLRGAGDISHIAGKVSANLAGLGPLGTGAHSIEESLDIASLPIQTQRAALLIYRLMGFSISKPADKLN